MIPFNFHHLYYFYVIAREGSVSKAANTLRLAQPTLSAQLKQFESFLEKSLFLRERRRLVLTDDGQEVLSYAKAIFDLGKEFMDRQGDLSKKGRIRIQIGIDPLVPKTIVYLLLQFLLKVSPNVFVVINESRLQDLLLRLQNHELDMILCDQLPAGETNKDLDVHLLSKIPTVFCGHPKFKHLSKNFPKSLDKAPLILPTASSGLAESVKSFFLELKIEPHIIGEVQDVEIVRRLVLDGVGIAPLNLLTIKKAPTPQKLFIFNQSKKPLILEKIYLISKRRRIPHPLTQQTISGFHPSSL
ncbi:MAG: LysR family transcriptional regulator [Verrucomicrobiota bacterium]|nr:LysR family transcriptional regulator [Verrucomicrobiota bacterium]